MNAAALVLLAAFAAVVSAAVSSGRDVREDCWDTGCQLDSWAVRGCEQYGRYAKKQRPCPNGVVYTCCLRGSEAVDAPTAVPYVPKCRGRLVCVAKSTMPAAHCKAVSKKAVKKMKPKLCGKGWVLNCCGPAEAEEPTTATEASRRLEEEDEQITVEH